MTDVADSQYGRVNLDRPFASAFVCLRCGALVASDAESEGKALHNSFHRRLEGQTGAGRDA